MTSSTTKLSVDIIVKSGRRLGRPDILFWTLPYLIFLIFIGTIAQKSMGLYEAQKMFFSSFVFFWYGVPLPSGYSALGVMSVNLICKFLFLSEWKRSKFGSHIAHLSIIILFIGGFLTALSIKEGYITLSEGESDYVISDYHKRVLTIGDNISIPFENLGKQRPNDVPFEIDILQICRNTAIRPRDDIDAPSNDGVGAASMAELVCIPQNIENERNVSGVTYRVNNSKSENGIYIVFEGRETHDEIMGLKIKLDREQRPLPFTIKLNRFNRDVYPGSNMPRDYESRVTITDGDVQWPAVISMNEPLRYGGYTFYQASTFVNQDNKPVSVLSVVTNKGWIFPYVSGILLAFGLIYHLIYRIKR